MDILLVKSIAIGIFFVITIVIGALTIPLFSSHSVERHARTVIPMFKCLTGGLFLGIVLLDLIPESEELMTEAIGDKIKFPMSGLIIGIALFFVLGTEELVESLHKARKQRKNSRVSSAKKSKLKDKLPACNVNYNSDAANHMDSVEKLTGERSDDERHGTMEDCVERTLKFELASREHDCGNDATGILEDNVLTSARSSALKSCALGVEIAIQTSRSSLENTHEGESVLNRIVITVVLCFHTVMEGMGLGLQKNSRSVWSLLIPLSLHQSLLAFIFTINLLRCHFRKRVIVSLIFILGISALLGAAIGAYFSKKIEQSCSKGDTQDTTLLLVNGILLNIATGTFLFITFFEMLKFDGEGPSGIWRLLIAVAGFCLIGGLDYLKVMDESGEEGIQNMNSTSCM